MKILFTGLWAKLKGELGFLVLLAVAIVGAWLYVQYRQIRADRDWFQHWAEVTCAGAGEGFGPSSAAAQATNGKTVTVDHSRGQLCARRVTDLAGFKSQSDQQTAELLAAAMREQTERQNTDTLAARSAAEAARSAAERMEAADAEAERKNLVDREWFAAVNGVAGLRPAGR